MTMGGRFQAAFATSDDRGGSDGEDIIEGSGGLSWKLLLHHFDNPVDVLIWIGVVALDVWLPSD